MTIRRRAAAIGAVTLGLLALAACEKPSPVTTVTAGSDSISFEAACYNEGEALAGNEQKKCLDTGSAETLELDAGDTLRIGVDPQVAENGWTLAINGQPTGIETVKDTYWSFNGQAFFQSQTGQTAKSVNVSLIEQGEKPNTTAGVWQFKLKLKD